MNVIERYARDIVAGRLPAGKFHRLACQRHLTDLQHQNTPEFPYRFELRKAELFFDFAELLRHYKGEWSGQLIQLSDFQKFRLGCIFGWRTRDGFRRFTTAYNELPRKTGKSFEAAIVAVYCTFFEGEPGAEGYCLATKEKQATDVVFRDIKQLIASSGLKSRLQVRVKNVHSEATMSKLEPLGSDSETLDGLNPHCIITDELHAFPSRGLLDVMESATGARRNPLHYQITTAGNDPVSVCGDQHDYACKILEGIFTDYSAQTFFCCIAHADPEDDWLAESTWIKANPHYGISVKPDDIRKLALKAKAIPSAAAEFQQKRLNLWVNADAPWLSLDGWRRGQSRWTPEEMAGEACWIGIDLSSKIDLTAVALVFPPTDDREQWRLIVHALTPEETLDDRARRDRAPYRQWQQAGYLRTNPGNRIDQSAVRELVHEAAASYHVEGIGIDPWNAGNLVAELHDLDGYDVVEIPQTLQQMSQVCKDFEADVLDGLVDAGGNPLLEWCVSNVVVQRDNKDNLYPVKKKSRGRIDPVIAALMARKLASVPVPPEAAYSIVVLGGAR